MRAVFKHLAERLLAASLAPVGRRIHRGRRLVLAYHNVVPRGGRPGGDVSLHLAEASFANQLEVLENFCEIVPLQALLEQENTAGSRVRCAITFDDAYKGALSAGVNELARRKLPATMFVAPGLLGQPGFWWDRFAPGGAGWSEEARAHALQVLGGREAAIAAWAAEAGVAEQELESHAGGGSLEDIQNAQARMNLAIGSHSWSHPNLARVTEAEFNEEFERPQVWLRENCRDFRPWIAYPYGIGGGQVESMAFRASYDFGFLVAGGWLVSQGGSLRLPRLNVPSGLSTDGFQLRLSGYFQ